MRIIVLFKTSYRLHTCPTQRRGAQRQSGQFSAQNGFFLACSFLDHGTRKAASVRSCYLRGCFQHHKTLGFRPDPYPPPSPLLAPLRTHRASRSPSALHLGPAHTQPGQTRSTKSHEPLRRSCLSKTFHCHTRCGKKDSQPSLKTASPLRPVATAYTFCSPPTFSSRVLWLTTRVPTFS